MSVFLKNIIAGAHFFSIDNPKNNQFGAIFEERERERYLFL